MNVGALGLVLTQAATAGDCAAIARSAGVLLDDWQCACLGLADDQRMVAARPEPGNWASAAVPTSAGAGQRFFLRSVAVPLEGLDAGYGFPDGPLRMGLIVGV